jgi:hypothetical protein
MVCVVTTPQRSLISGGPRDEAMADIDVLNTLDGFNLQPRVSVPFTGAIDVATVNSGNVFFLSLGDTLGGGGGQVVGINQVVWDPLTFTLHAESDELLDQHTRYALIVTDGIRDTAGDPVGPSPFRQALDFGQTHDARLKAYRKSLLDAIEASGVNPDTAWWWRACSALRAPPPCSRRSVTASRP